MSTCIYFVVRIGETGQNQPSIRCSSPDAAYTARILACSRLNLPFEERQMLVTYSLVNQIGIDH